MDKRCAYCNWLNKEIDGDFYCKNCSKENIVKEVDFINQTSEEAIVEIVKPNKKNNQYSEKEVKN